MLHSPDLPNLASSQPSDPRNFRILVQAMIGLEGNEAADTFDFVVCTPAWLTDHVKPENPVIERGLIVVDHFDYKQIQSEISRICALAVAPNWREIASILSRYARWEYEGQTD